MTIEVKVGQVWAWAGTDVWVVARVSVVDGDHIEYQAINTTQLKGAPREGVDKSYHATEHWADREQFLNNSVLLFNPEIPQPVIAEPPVDIERANRDRAIVKALMDCDELAFTARDDRTSVVLNHGDAGRNKVNRLDALQQLADFMRPAGDSR